MLFRSTHAAHPERQIQIIGNNGMTNADAGGFVRSDGGDVETGAMLVINSGGATMDGMGCKRLS